MNCSTPGLPVHHQLAEFTQTHVHWVGDAIQPSHPLSSPSPPAPNPSQHQSLFQWVKSTWGGQSIGVSASTSVPPMNTQDWSPLGWTGWCILAGIIAINPGTKCPPKDQSNIKEIKVSIFSGSLLWLFVSFSIMFLLPPLFITYTIGLPMGTGNAALISVCVRCQREWERVGHITCTEDAICSTNHNGFNCIICYSFLQTLFYSTGNIYTKRGKKITCSISHNQISTISEFIFFFSNNEKLNIY